MEDYIYQTCPRCKCFSSSMYKVPVDHYYALGDHSIKERFLKCEKCKSNFINARTYSTETVSWFPSEQKVHKDCYVKKLKRGAAFLNKVTVIYLFSPILSDRQKILEGVEEYIKERPGTLGVITLVDWFSGQEISEIPNSLSDICQNIVILPQTLFMGSRTTQFPSLWAERVVFSIRNEYPKEVQFATVYPAIMDELDECTHIIYWSGDIDNNDWSDDQVKYFDDKWVSQSSEEEIFIGVSQ